MSPVILKPETVGFVRGGMLFLEPPAAWRKWQRDIWHCCQRTPSQQLRQIAHDALNRPLAECASS